MIRNYLLVAFRNIWRNKFFSLINITGLTLGLSMFIILWINIKYELSFDDFHEKKDNIYLLKQTITIGTGDYTASRCGAMQAPALESNFPEIRKSVRLSSPFELVMAVTTANTDSTNSNIKFIERSVIAVDSTFFDIFTFPLLRGDPNTVLQHPNSIILTERMANKYFGGLDPVDQIITIGDSIQFRVTGITDDPPEKSSILFDFIVPLGFMERLGYDLSGYGGTVFFNYFLLQENADIKQLNIKIPDLLKTLYTSDLNPVPFLEPLHRVRLYGEEQQYIGVYLMIIMAVVILFIAVINFINLSTARSLSRAKEIGIRKVSGAKRSQLIFQFLGESLLISIIAMNFALFAVEHILPAISRFLGIQLVIQWNDGRLIVEFLCITVIAGMLAGIYPAFLLSSYKPAIILRNKLHEKFQTKGGTSRKILVVVQYVISLLFIIFTVVMIRQFNDMSNADLGFKRDNILYFSMRGKTKSSYQEIKSDLLNYPFIKNVTTSSELPLFVSWGEIEWGDAERKKNIIARILCCGYDFTDAFDIEIVEGRFYSREFASDTMNGILVNEAVVKIMGWDEPIGKEFYFGDKKHYIIGVIGDIKFFPFNIGGSALILPFEKTNDIAYVSLGDDWSNEDISRIQSVYEKHEPSYPFEYDLLADYKYDILQNAKKSSIIFAFVSALGILVSCLGLLGLTYFMADKRRKEICVRKAFGSTAVKVMFLFSAEFARLIAIAIAISIPLSYLMMSLILQFFTIRTQLSWWIFVFAIVLTFIAAMSTIVFQTIRIAASDPATHLRYE